jgi:hypothetical protein
VPTEVGKVGVESPTFIEPVQKRKDGIEAMFMRQTKAKESAKAAGTDKRKHEPESSPSPAEAEMKEETRTGTPVTVTTASPTSPSPAKRVKTEKKRDPMEPMQIVDVDAGEPAEDNNKSGSDIEILSPPGPSPSSQPVPYCPPPLSPFSLYSRNNTIAFFHKGCEAKNEEERARRHTSVVRFAAAAAAAAAATALIFPNGFQEQVQRASGSLPCITFFFFFFVFRFFVWVLTHTSLLRVPRLVLSWSHSLPSRRRRARRKR